MLEHDNLREKNLPGLELFLPDAKQLKENFAVLVGAMPIKKKKKR